MSKPPDFFPRQLRNVGKCYTYTHADGRKLQDGAFGAIIVKGRVLQTDEVITQSFNKGVRCDKDAKTSMSWARFLGFTSSQRNWWPLHIFSLSRIKLCISTSTILDNPSIMIDKKGVLWWSFTQFSFEIAVINQRANLVSIGEYLPEYTHICNIEADFSALCTDRNREKGSDGDYWQLNFNVGKSISSGPTTYLYCQHVNRSWCFLGHSNLLRGNFPEGLGVLDWGCSSSIFIGLNLTDLFFRSRNTIGCRNEM